MNTKIHIQSFTQQKINNNKKITKKQQNRSTDCERDYLTQALYRSSNHVGQNWINFIDFTLVVVLNKLTLSLYLSLSKPSSDLAECDLPGISFVTQKQIHSSSFPVAAGM